MSRSEVDSYKAYLTTHDPRFHPKTMEKQAALEHDFQVQLWKQKMANLAQALGAAPGQLPPAKQIPPASQMIPPAQQQPAKPGGAPTLTSEMDQAGEDKPTYDIGGQPQGQEVPTMSKSGSQEGYVDGYQKVGAGMVNENVSPSMRRLVGPDQYEEVPEGYETWSGDRVFEVDGRLKMWDHETGRIVDAPEEYAQAYGTSRGSQQKVARGGHPNNIAFARALRPGMFPGLDENRGMKFRFAGDINQAAQEAFENSFRMAPETQDYLYGNQKRAEDSAHQIKSTQTCELDQEGEEEDLGVAIKEQKITTDPKMAGNEKTANCGGAHDKKKKKKKADMAKTASERNWWFNNI